MKAPCSVDNMIDEITYDEISTNFADAIPYKSFKEKNSIVNQELSKDRFVEVWDELKVIYSAEKWEKEC